MLRAVHNIKNIEDDAVLAVCCVRNEVLRLPWFLEYHRKLGITRFLIVDNNSTDDTSEYLGRQDDVSLFFTEESYAESKCGVTWTNELLGQFCLGHWSLILDADELIVYPNCEQIGLQQLVRHLESENAEAMVAPLLDMYSDRPIGETLYESGQPFLETCPYFDGGGYQYVTFGEQHSKVRIRGGARHRLFWGSQERNYPSPVLRKIPLVKWRDGLALEASTHNLHGARFARVSGLLLHFKLFHDFAPRARVEAARKEHYAGARQYVAYSEVLSRNEQMTAYYEGSVRYENSLQLARLGFMSMPEGFPNSQK